MLASFLRSPRTPARSAFPPTRGFARLTLIGRIGGEPELKTASNGSEYVKYTVVTDNPTRPLPDGTYPPRSSTWHNITSFIPPTYERLTSLRRGAHVYVEATYDMKKLPATEEFPARQMVSLRHDKIIVLDKGPNADPSMESPEQ
ncbi:hypothetical protein RSOLAG22IIIB_02330 [Rhizoctonia solani]|uniref:Single-stranded DNA-binding protein RIM1, mitochondrial n=1 Tax=Rhizoctonia solani TaxID=456999 RepID=A0A0K6GEN8_9AGAM|nr:hypothetical protein RSOLAG22IIIB_02330 [Rhizoctonia solani]